MKYEEGIGSDETYYRN